MAFFPFSRFLFFGAGSCSVVYTGWLRTYHVALAGLELAIALLPQLTGYVGWSSEPPQLAPVLCKLSVLMSEVRQAGPLHVLGTWEK